MISTCRSGLVWSSQWGRTEEKALILALVVWKGRVLPRNDPAAGSLVSSARASTMWRHSARARPLWKFLTTRVSLYAVMVCYVNGGSRSTRNGLLGGFPRASIGFCSLSLTLLLRCRELVWIVDQHQRGGCLDNHKL